jgi:hypothetical protein
VTQAPKNVVASVFASLRNVAQEGGISFNNILQSYVIERFVLWEWTSARFPVARKRHVASVCPFGLRFRARHLRNAAHAVLPVLTRASRSARPDSSGRCTI